MWVRDRREAILSGLDSTLLLDQITTQLRSDPLGIHLLYQADVLGAAPTFEFLLAGNGGANVVGILEVHQALQKVFAGKAWRQPMLVLVYAAAQVIGDTDVEPPHAIGH